MNPSVRDMTVVFSCTALFAGGVRAQEHQTKLEQRVEIESGTWRLVGDLRLPTSPGPHPAVLLLNQAAGSRASYAELASQLVSRGIVSLRLDLRGHGESTNLGRFVPGGVPRDPLIWDAEADVIAGYGFLAAQEVVDPTRIGVMGASYSGEEAAEAGRLGGYASLYVFLSPGSLSDASITSMARAGMPWLYVAARDDPYLEGITEALRRGAPGAEVLLLPGESHGTDLLRDHETLVARVAEWIDRNQRPPAPKPGGAVPPGGSGASSCDAVRVCTCAFRSGTS